MTSWFIAFLLWCGGSALSAEIVPVISEHQQPSKQSAQKLNPKKMLAKASRRMAQKSVFESTGELQRFQVKIVSPRPIDEIVGRLTVRAEVVTERPSGVSAVDFFIDGRLLFSDVEAPYELLWNPGSFAEHLIEVLAY